MEPAQFIHSVNELKNKTTDFGGSVAHVEAPSIPAPSNPNNLSGYNFVAFEYAHGLKQLPDQQIVRYISTDDDRFAGLIYETPVFSFSSTSHLKKSSTNNGDARERDLPEGFFSHQWTNTQIDMYKKACGLKQLLIKAYVSSWSLSDENSQSLWNRYGDSEEGVCLVTTPRRFLSAIAQPIFHGAISYVPERLYSMPPDANTKSIDLPLLLNGKNRAYSDNELCSILTGAYRPSEFIKSDCYRDENEYRFCTYILGTGKYPDFLYCPLKGKPFEKVILGSKCNISFRDIKRLEEISDEVVSRQDLAERDG